MWLLAGLGNPGGEYAGNRHNIGFMVIDALAARYGASSFRTRFHGQLAEITLAGEKACLLKPQTYMNRSGTSVAEVANFYKIEPSHIIVIHDELDLPLGRIRTKQGGGAGGHNGLKSIDAHIGQNYWRLRLGIGHPGDKDRVSPYVLSDFAKTEKPEVDKLIEEVAREFPEWITAGAASFTNKISLALQPPAKDKVAPAKKAEDKA